jgi:hypothetical protein
MAGRTDTGRPYTPPSPPPASRYQGAGTATATAPRPTTAALTHDQIALRAREIWLKKGCPIGQDRQNWLEAEAQLRTEQRSR